MSKPDWKYWKLMPEVEQWQACALAFDVDPKLLVRNSDIPPATYSLPDYFYHEEPAQQFYKLAKLLKVHRFSGGHFTLNGKAAVRLDDFAAWCVGMDLDIPQELRAMAKAKTQAALVATEEALQIENSPVKAETDNSKILAALFDAVPVEALEKMFGASGNWKIWADKAKENGLIHARTSRAKFNPFMAGLWFVRRGAEGWDDARLNRTLANNLPARSLDNKHMLTDGID